MKKVQSLLQELNDEDAVIRAEAAWALGLIGLQARSAVPALLKALKDPDADVRSDAAWALYLIGPEGDSAVPALREALSDSDTLVRRYAGRTLGEIDGALPELAKEEREALDSVTLDSIRKRLVGRLDRENGSSATEG